MIFSSYHWSSFYVCANESRLFRLKSEWIFSVGYFGDAHTRVFSVILNARLLREELAVHRLLRCSWTTTASSVDYAGHLFKALCNDAPSRSSERAFGSTLPAALQHYSTRCDHLFSWDRGVRRVGDGADLPSIENKSPSVWRLPLRSNSTAGCRSHEWKVDRGGPVCPSISYLWTARLHMRGYVRVQAKSIVACLLTSQQQQQQQPAAWSSRRRPVRHWRRRRQRAMRTASAKRRYSNLDTGLSLTFGDRQRQVIDAIGCLKFRRRRPACGFSRVPSMSSPKVRNKCMRLATADLRRLQYRIFVRDTSLHNPTTWYVLLIRRSVDNYCYW